MRVPVNPALAEWRITVAQILGHLTNLTSRKVLLGGA
jgi:hypothetical protein